MSEYKLMWKRWVDFNGFSNRREFWMAYLINLILAFFILLVARSTGLIFLIWLYSLFIIIPSLSLGVRRLQDAGFSPLFLLLSFVPFIGWIVLIVLWCLDSKWY